MEVRPDQELTTATTRSTQHVDPFFMKSHRKVCVRAQTEIISRLESLPCFEVNLIDNSRSIQQAVTTGFLYSFGDSRSDGAPVTGYWRGDGRNYKIALKQIAIIT